MKEKNFYIYRIYYGKQIVYVGRTKQKLTDRIRGHLFNKPMHKKINIKNVSKIEFTKLPTEADMNLYEIYYILRLRPALNIDDKAKDSLTVELPPLEWQDFSTPLWDKWMEELAGRETEIKRLKDRYFHGIPEEQSDTRTLYRTGEIEEEEMYGRLVLLENEKKEIYQKLYG